MVKILLDSWAWAEYFENGELAGKVLEQIVKASEILTTTVNVHGCCFRIFRNEGETGVKEAVSFIKERAVVLDVDLETALLAIELRQKYKLHTSDSLCYAAALENDAKIVTGDPDFKDLPNVIFIH